MTIRGDQPSLDFPMVSDPLAGPSLAEAGIAELKALVGEGLTNGAFFEVVRAGGVPAPDLRAWSTQKLNDVLQRLIARRVLMAGGDISPDWQAPLIVRVALRPDGAELSRRVRAAAPKSWRE